MPQSGMTNALREFEEYLRQTASPLTARAYLSDVRQFEAFRLGREPSAVLLREWFAGMALNPQTKARKLAAVRKWLGFRAVAGDGAAERTLLVLGVGGYHVTRGPRQADRKVRDPVDRRDWVEASARAPEWGAAIMDLLWWTGARVSELVGAPLSQIPPLTVGDGLALSERGHVLTVGKGGKRRALVIPAVGRQRLAIWVAGTLRRAGLPGVLSPGATPGGPTWSPISQAAGAGSARWARVLSQPLFRRNGVSSAGVGPDAVNAMLRASGLRQSAHSFRHAFKARLRRAGVREETVRAMMGHGPRDATDLYGGVTVEEMMEAVEAMAAREEAGP